MSSDVRVADCDLDRLLQAVTRFFHGAAVKGSYSSACKVLTTADPEDVLIATCDGSLVGAVIAKPAPGQLGWLWPPVVVGSSLPGRGCAEVSRQLIHAAISKLTKSGVRVVQALVPVDEPGGQDLMACGFSRLTEMIRMDRASDTLAKLGSHSPSLAFLPFSPQNRREFLDVIERTYIGSQDCIELDGYRSVPEVLAGYQSSDSFRADLWLLVRESARSVGCVLSMHFPDENYCELQYMGVVPEARGHQIGRALCSRAILDAARIGARKLSLAVDVRNLPALKLYASLGFAETERRIAYLLILNHGTEKKLSTI